MSFLPTTPASPAKAQSLRRGSGFFSFRDVNRADRFFGVALRACALALCVLLLAIAAFLLRAAWPALDKFGFAMLSSTVWDPVNDVFGAAPVVFGTVVSALLAVAIAMPLSVGVALFLTELAPRQVVGVIGFLIEMLAAIPSVVYGLWGIFVLAPWLRTTIQPFLSSNFGFLPFFSGPAYGVGMLTAAIILAIMITPTIASLSREVFRAIPRSQREAALALGSTRWEMISLSVLKSARSGIFGATILGLGRALGETMAVTMVIGNRSQISASLFAPSQTMASLIANEYAEASSQLHVSALLGVGFMLFGVTFVVNVLARVMIGRLK